jgi:hypothetical protein
MRNHSTSQGTFSCGCLLAVIGIFIFCFAFLLPKIVIEKAKQESRQTIIVNSNTSEYYASWQNNSQQDMEPYIEAFTFMNLTNPDLVLKGQKPVFHEVGPYYYRVVKTKQNVTFSEDLKNVSFIPYDIWYYDDKMTDKNLNPHKDVITNLNFGFIGLMTQSEAENTAISGYVSIIWKNWLSGIFQHEFMDDTFWTYGFDYFQETLGKIMDDFVHKNNKTLPEAQNIVWQAWANFNKTGNLDDIDFPDALKVSLNQNPLNINEGTAQKLFNDSHVEYSLSYKSPYNNSVLKVWNNSPLNNDIKTKILTTFNLTPQQLDSIINWLKSDRFHQWVKNKLVTQFKLNNYTDLYLLQFATGSVTKKVPLINIYPQLLPSASLGDYKSPELYFGGGYDTGDGGKPFTVETVRKLLYGPLGFLGGPLNIKVFKQYQNNENWTYLNDTWGVTQENIMGLTMCMIITHIQVAKSQVMSFVANGSGIITSRVAHKWMFDACDDSLINNFLGYTKCVNFRHNATVDNTKYFTIYTGYKNISLIANYIQWNGTTNSAFGEKIFGTNTDGQFAPFDYDNAPNMTVFEDSYQRTLQLVPEKNRVTFNGINLVDYRLSNDAWAQKNAPGYNISGFSWIGPSYEKIPIYFSNPFYHLASKDWLNKVDIQPLPPTLNDTYNDTRPLYTKTYIDYLTGKVMWANKCLQINIYLSTSTILAWFGETDTFGYKGLTANVMWPVTYIRQHGKASEKQATLYKEKFNLLTTAKTVGVAVGIAVGILFVVVGVIIATIGVISMNNHQTYETLNSGSRLKK